MAATAEFGLLGPLVVRCGGRDVTIPPGKQRVLLAALLVKANQVVPLDDLIEALWGAEPPPSARVTLQNYVVRLRKALQGAGTRISTQPRGYVLRAEAGELDVTRFDALLRAAKEAARSGSWALAADRASAALALWRGEPLADVESEELTLRQFPRLAELRLQALEARIDADLHLGRHDDVIPELWLLVDAHPLREHLCAQLMEALWHGGRQAEALTAYQDARRALVDGLGVEPGAELRELQQRILTAEPQAAGTAPAGTPPAGTAPAGTAPELPPAPRQLPPPVPDFVGRAAELRELTGLLDACTVAPGGTVIAVICGAAGVGKTALAVHWAYQAAGSFPDGQLYLNLNGFGPADLPVTRAEAVGRILEALQVPGARIPASLDGRVGLCRTLLSERRTLIVLDNAKDAEQVRPLLPGGAGSLVLVTSRSPLTGLVALENARPITLSVLTKAEARQMVAQRLGGGQTAADRAAADELIDVCARLPLALAIATALVATRPGRSLATVTSNLRRADSRLDILSTGEATSSLRAVFCWSYQALTSGSARMFRLLAEHPGPDISVAAAASLAGVSSARADDALARLADAHLIIEQADGRFALHDLLRLYATEMLSALDSPAERRAAGRRMLDHYLHTAWTAARAVSPIRNLLELEPAVPGANPEDLAGKDEAIAWLRAERQILMRAIAYAVDAGSDVHAWQIPWALTDFLERGGHWTDFAATQRTALAAAERLGNLAAQAHAHRYIGRACFQLQDPDQAISHLTRALDLRRELREPADEAGVSLDLCRVHEQVGHIDQALSAAQHALRLYRSARHRVGEAQSLNSVGWYHAVQRHYPQALSYCSRALELCVELDYKIAEGHTLHSLGFIHQHLGHSRQSITCYRRAVDIYRQVMDRYTESLALADLGDACHAAGDPAAACTAWRDALAILDDLDHPDADRLRAKIASAGPSTSGARRPTVRCRRELARCLPPRAPG